MEGRSLLTQLPGGGPCFAVLGEGFSGSRAPLSWAMAVLGKKVIKTHDKDVGPWDNLFEEDPQFGQVRRRAPHFRALSPRVQVDE